MKGSSHCSSKGLGLFWIPFFISRAWTLELSWNYTPLPSWVEGGLQFSQSDLELDKSFLHQIKNRNRACVLDRRKLQRLDLVIDFLKSSALDFGWSILLNRKRAPSLWATSEFWGRMIPLDFVPQKLSLPKPSIIFAGWCLWRGSTTRSLWY